MPEPLAATLCRVKSAFFASLEAIKYRDWRTKWEAAIAGVNEMTAKHAGYRLAVDHGCSVDVSNVTTSVNSIST